MEDSLFLRLFAILLKTVEETRGQIKTRVPLAGQNHAVFHMISLIVFFFKIYFTVTKELAGYFQSAAVPLLLPYEYMHLWRMNREHSCLENLTYVKGFLP